MITKLLLDRRFLFLLLLVNFLGTIYGYMWYGNQLSNTPVHFLLFVPDSPTASLFFTIFLCFFLIGRKVPYIEALAVITLFKYGIWAVVMNGLTYMVNGTLPWQAYMLIVSHGAMAIQGLLYAPFYTIKMRHIAFAGIWTLHNDIIDYVFGMMPVYASLTKYMEEIGYFTFWLSIASISITYYITMRNRTVHTYK
jgi:uncharacterized membrane protein YpjA